MKILIVTDNLPDQVNGVVTTFTNIEKNLVLDGYSVLYLNPRRRHIGANRHLHVPPVWHGNNNHILRIGRHHGNAI